MIHHYPIPDKFKIMEEITHFATKYPKAVFVMIRPKDGNNPFTPITLMTLRDWHLFNYVISEPGKELKNSIDQLNNAAANHSIPRDYLIAQSAQVYDLLYEKIVMRL